MVRKMSKRDVSAMEPPPDLVKEREQKSINNANRSEQKKSRNTVLKFSTKEKWDLSGSILDCLLKYADQLTKEELEEIIKGIEEGLSDQQIKEYFSLQDAEKMSQFRRMFRSVNRRNI